MTFDFIRVTGAETAATLNIRKELIYKVREIPDGFICQYPLAQTEIKLLTGEVYYVLESTDDVMAKF